MILTSGQEDSEFSMMESIYKLADAGASILQIRTREPIRTALVLRKNILSATDSDRSEYREWDTVNGFRTFTSENYVDHKRAGEGEDFMAAIMEPLSELRKASSSINAYPNKMHYFAYLNPQPFLEHNPLVTELIQQYAAILSTNNVCLIFITPEIPLSSLPVGTVLVTEMRTPSATELEEVVRSIVIKSQDDFEEGSELEDDDFRRLSYVGLGLSLFEFETYTAISIIEASAKGDKAITFEALNKGISTGKTEVVKQSDILELTQSASMADVGGMARLKDWVASRAGCYSDEAKEFGIEPPKGIVVVGVPGTGKSLVAKATASELGVPLVAMDFSRVFSKYIGDSESRIRSALKMVEDMAPCVLFLDELDKGLGGAGDNGTSSRVLGSFLTWLQDCKAPVFVMVTANRTDGLPPELLRRGRFDQVFSVGLPSDLERLEILQIHLRKRKRNLTFTKDETFAFTKASKDYVPAEIESAVRDGLIAAFNNGREALKMQHILDALAEMVPMSKSNAAQIEAIVEWAENNATPVNYAPNATPILTGATAPTRRMRRTER